ncbi:hypothetical protein B0H11DRAFT_2240236 [Mycena galericulata]|nr:hypothetical protein B0H11DRAFT_2240236 [Mycena galericulata]
MQSRPALRACSLHSQRQIVDSPANGRVAAEEPACRPRSTHIARMSPWPADRSLEDSICACLGLARSSHSCPTGAQPARAHVALRYRRTTQCDDFVWRMHRRLHGGVDLITGATHFPLGRRKSPSSLSAAVTGAGDRFHSASPSIRSFVLSRTRSP